MGKALKALAIDRNSADAQALVHALGPEIVFEEVEHTTSILKALKSHEEVKYQVCLIADSFPTDDLEVFFDDIKSMNRDLGCVFVQVRNEIEPGFDRYELAHIGIDFIISRDGTQHDKDGLQEVIKIKLVDEDPIKERMRDVSKALDILLREIDKAAANKKRGREDTRTLTSLSMDFIEMQTKFDQAILDRYYHNLISRANSAAPIVADHLDVPDKILEKELPHLNKEGYLGASHRVWQKLLRHHGVKEPKTKDIEKDSPEHPDESS